MYPSAPRPTPQLLRTRDLLLSGMSERDIRRAVAAGALRRVRKGTFVHAECDDRVAAALGAGGRLGCVSELARRGVFVHGGAEDSVGTARTHLHVAATASRLASSAQVRLHWADLARAAHPRDAVVDIVDALIQSAACQTPRAFIASVDSALHLRLLHPDDVDVVFARLPRRFRRLRGLVDGRAESGPETLVRLMLRALGRRAELQVEIAGVGRVDLLVDGWLVIECDSRAFHSTWSDQHRDRRRDQALAARGYVVYRPIAEDILYDPEAVIAALKGLLGRGRRSAR